MAKNVVALFENAQQAQSALQDLQGAGIPRDQINLVTQDRRAQNDVPNFAQDTERVEKGEAIMTDTAAGALFGGAGGALLGVAALAIPGLGPILAAGPIAATIAGVITGAAGGAAIGALQDAGIGEGDAHIYAEAVRRGGTLLMVHTSDDNSDRVQDLLDRHKPVDIDELSEDYRRGGWDRFDETREFTAVGSPASGSASTARSGTGSGDVAGIAPTPNSGSSMPATGTAPNRAKPDLGTGSLMPEQPVTDTALSSTAQPRTRVYSFRTDQR